MSWQRLALSESAAPVPVFHSISCPSGETRKRTRYTSTVLPVYPLLRVLVGHCQDDRQGHHALQKNEPHPGTSADKLTIIEKNDGSGE